MTVEPQPEAGLSQSRSPAESFTRPPFHPSRSTSTTLPPPWLPALTHNIQFPLSSFLYSTKDLVLHPERNSSLILRADPLPAQSPASDPEAGEWGLERYEELRVRLMPKQPKRDGKLDQRVTFYSTSSSVPGAGSSEGERGLVIMQPQNVDGDLPFYYPPVKKIAFIYTRIPQPSDPNAPPSSATNDQRLDGQGGEGVPMIATLEVAYVPLDTAHALTGPAQLNGIDGPVPPNPLLGRPPRSPRKRSPLAATSTGNGNGNSGNDVEGPADDEHPPPVEYKRSPLATSSASATSDTSETKPPAQMLAGLSIGSAPQPDPRQNPDRIVRICQLLMERVYKHAYGNWTGYKKRVNHDVVVSREPFQDLYLVLKDRHRHLESRAPKAYGKVEDVKRHVWKIASLPDDPSLPLDDMSHWGSQDVAIATFLMLLWKDMYPAREEGEREWDSWGRPAGGFVDLGCGNGLLVHILTAEGYQGKGYELRERKTWPLYPPETRANLVEMPISFPSWFPRTIDEWESGSWPGKDDCPIREDCFIIGNHADEITPWIPLLSLLPSRPIPHLSLPCCLHTLDSAFTSNTYTPPHHPREPVGGLESGIEDGQSRYKSYLLWLAWCGLQCGWKWEKENLRIPSTKGWAIVARNRWTTTDEELRECRDWALSEVNAVRGKGIFKVRVKEGKDRDH